METYLFKSLDMLVEEIKDIIIKFIVNEHNVNVIPHFDSLKTYKGKIYINNIIIDKIPEKVVIDKLFSYHKFDINKDNKNVYKYREFTNRKNCITEYCIETLMFKKLYFPLFNELNDPIDGFTLDSITRNSKLKFFRVLSLSTSKENDILWNYYGLGKSGYRCDIETNDIVKNYNYSKYMALGPVIYLNDVYNRIKYIKKDVLIFLKTSKIIEAIISLFVKDKTWELENEYRVLIYDTKKIPQHVKIDSMHFKVGKNMSKNNNEIFKKFIK